MNKSNTANISILRRAARNAAMSGHYKEAQGIYQRLLKVIAEVRGTESDEYKDCLTEAGQSLHPSLLKEAANA